MASDLLTSHAFSLRKGQPAKGLQQWPDFDQQVLGGNYHDHYPNEAKTFVQPLQAAAGHPILDGIALSEFRVFGSLYKNYPLATTAAPLMLGRVAAAEMAEPVAWTHQRPNRGRIFYTSLGHPQSFEVPQFQRLLRNATYWAAGLPSPPLSPRTASLTQTK